VQKVLADGLAHAPTILAIRADCADSGVFNIAGQPPELVQFNLTQPWDLAALRKVVKSWALALPST
jgi:hypothetical protein